MVKTAVDISLRPKARSDDVKPIEAQMTESLRPKSREDAKQDMEKIKQDILTSDRSANDLRVPGVKSFKYKEDTLKRL